MAARTLILLPGSDGIADVDNQLRINDRVAIPLDQIELTAIRAQGAGGQNVNKVSSAIHLRFQVQGSSLPQTYQARLLSARDRRINSDGVIIIKAQRYRSQDKNRADALARLAELIRKHTTTARKRKPTAPSRAARRKRLDAKQRRGRLKQLRSSPSPD